MVLGCVVKPPTGQEMPISATGDTSYAFSRAHPAYHYQVAGV